MNLGHTTLDRLRLVFGAILVFAGLFSIFFLGSFYGYSNSVIWLVGLGAIIIGVVLAPSRAVAELIIGFFS